MKTYETEHLIFRAYNENDLEDGYAFMGNSENVKYLLTEPQSREQCLEFIRYAIEKYLEEPCLQYHFAIVIKGTERVIGSCGLSIFDKDQGGVNWVIHRDFQGNGYGNELGGFLLKLAFEDLKLRRVISSCDTRNEPSFRVMEKIGMHREGCFIGARSASKQFPDFHGDEYSYEILREEYFEKLF